MTANYYMDRHGKDLFKQFEAGLYPAQYSILFCLGNYEKYLRRAGKKQRIQRRILKRQRTTWTKCGHYENYVMRV